MADIQLTDELRDETTRAWYRYLELAMPFRADLHRYCRSLTGDLWDAEDLLQDTLLKGFATLGVVHHRIDNPRGYLIRIATNLWIDLQRRRVSERAALLSQADEPPGSSVTASPLEAMEMRDAAAVLLTTLAPREQAAVLLKDVFQMDLKEIASVLATTVGAVKSALHRARSRLRQPETCAAKNVAAASRGLIDRFCEYYNQRNLQGLLSIMLDDASIELLGLDLETGRESFERPGGWFHHNLYGPPGWPSEQPWPARWESAVFRGEVVALVFGPNLEQKEVLQSVMRFEEEDGYIARIRAYALCPETVSEVGRELNFQVEGEPYQMITLILAFARGDPLFPPDNLSPRGTQE